MEHNGTTLEAGSTYAAFYTDNLRTNVRRQVAVVGGEQAAQMVSNSTDARRLSFELLASADGDKLVLALGDADVVHAADMKSAREHGYAEAICGVENVLIESDASGEPCLVELSPEELTCSTCKLLVAEGNGDEDATAELDGMADEARNAVEYGGTCDNAEVAHPGFACNHMTGYDDGPKRFWVGGHDNGSTHAVGIPGFEFMPVAHTTSLCGVPVELDEDEHGDAAVLADPHELTCDDCVVAVMDYFVAPDNEEESSELGNSSTTARLIHPLEQLAAILVALNAQEANHSLEEDAADALGEWVEYNLGLEQTDERWDVLHGEGWDIVGIEYTLGGITSRLVVAESNENN